MKLNLQPVALRPLVEKVFADLKPPADTKTSRSSTSCPNSPPRRTRAGSNRFSPTSWTTPSNMAARRARSPSAEKNLTTDKIEIFVQDDGPGIPPESLDRISSGFTAWTRRGRASRAARGWAFDRQAHRARPRRRSLGEKRARQGRDVFLHAAGRKDRMIDGRMMKTKIILPSIILLRSFLPAMVSRCVTMKGHEVPRIDTIENKSTCPRRLELACCKP